MMERLAGHKGFFGRRWLVWSSLLLAHYAITLYNRYPILYSDAATYLHSGFGLEAPADRPITYGLLLRLFSLNGLTLMLVPLFQSAIYLFVLNKFLGLFFEKERTLKYLFFISLSILLLSGIGWCLTLLLPDIYTAVGFLCLLSILMSGEKPRNLWILFILFFVATASHISNVAVFFALAALAFVAKRWFFSQADKKVFRQKLAIVAGILLVSYLIMGSAISKSKAVFTMGNLAQKGILQEVLRDSCATSQFSLCAYKDSIPRSFEYFVWKENSPVYKLGGWKKTREEFKKIISISFSQPKYIGMHVRESARNLVQQLGTFGIGEGTGSFGESTTLIQRIKNYTCDDAICLQTRQYRGELIGKEAINTFYKISMALAILLLLVLLAISVKRTDSRIRTAVVFTLLLMLISSLLVAFGSEVSNRYGCKIAWLVMLLDAILLLQLRQPYLRK